MPTRGRRHGISTIAIHGGREHANHGAPVVEPLVQSVSFAQDIGTAEGLRYPRYGNTPNAETVQRRLALVVDSTFASPVNFRPIEHGADVVIQSATKFLNGHHDVLGGAVMGTGSFIEEVREKMMVWGQAPDPFAAWLLERGLKTVDLRVRRQNENALRIAEWCTERKEVKRTHYPGLASHPDHDIARTLLDGFGGMMALELSGGARAAERFVRKLKLFRHAPSLGSVESLVSEPRFTSHHHVDAEQRARAGVPDGFLRLSVGIESAGDLIADIEQALR